MLATSPLKSVIEAYCICSNVIHKKINTIMDGIIVGEISGHF